MLQDVYQAYMICWLTTWHKVKTRAHYFISKIATSRFVHDTFIYFGRLPKVQFLLLQHYFKLNERMIQNQKQTHVITKQTIKEFLVFPEIICTKLTWFDKISQYNSLFLRYCPFQLTFVIKVEKFALLTEFNLFPLVFQRILIFLHNTQLIISWVFMSICA